MEHEVLKKLIVDVMILKRTSQIGAWGFEKVQLENSSDGEHLEFGISY